MKTLFEIPTAGDDMTLPGGIALRAREDGSEFVVHSFTTDRATGTERHYFGGHYYNAGSPANRLMNALTTFNRLAERASTYDTGGSIDMETLLGLSAGIPA